MCCSVECKRRVKRDYVNARYWESRERLGFQRMRVPHGQSTKERTSANKKNCRLKYAYGIGLRDLEALIVEQDQRCALCGDPFDRTKPRGSGTPHVDHCHKTKQVRGVLCHDCNVGLGAFKDDSRRLKLAIVYLERLLKKETNPPMM